MGSKILGSNKDSKLTGKEKLKTPLLEKSALRFLIAPTLIATNKNAPKTKKSV
ncbi:hypothetical protein HPIN_00735 [Helicobacter pylori India7]|uniref:Uncharacterized protein n=1 Tax=Helicobacter pylori (strain India7) TaxID=907238 RepID=E8QDT8_HELP7|nr:hypothetical protein HPIN_00735 [Helicobacter pylori India7]